MNNHADPNRAKPVASGYQPRYTVNPAGRMTHGVMAYTTNAVRQVGTRRVIEGTGRVSEAFPVRPA